MKMTRIVIFALPFLAVVLGVYFLTPRSPKPGATRHVETAKLPTVEPKWSYKIAGQIFPPIALDDNGNVYAAGEDGYLYSIGPDGRKRWEYQAGASEAAPVVANDTVYLSTIDGQFYAFNLDGTRRWQSNINSHRDRGAPAATQYQIYAECHMGSICAIDAGSGNEQWESNGIPPGSDDDDQPRIVRGFHLSEHNASAVTTDGNIVIGALRGKFVEVRQEDGQLQWQYSVGDEKGGDPNRNWGSFNAPAIASDGTIYVGSTNGDLYAFSSGGQKQWTFNTGGAVNASPVIALDGTIYFGSEDKNLYALTPSGTLKWKIDLGAPIGFTPAIAADGTIYVANGATFSLGGGGQLYAISPDGTVKWVCDPKNGLLNSPAIGSDGTVYVGSSLGTVYAIPGTGGGLAPSAWPKFHHDNGNSGVAQP